MSSTLTQAEEAQLAQTIEMFEAITQSQPHDCQSLEILKEAYSKLGREKDVVGASKRIALAYAETGQLSSAILEYETLLQRCPDDAEIKAALARIDRTSALPIESSNGDGAPAAKTPAAPVNGAKTPGAAAPAVLDDGRQTMYKLFVETKNITAASFDSCWATPDPHQRGIREPFIQRLADKGILAIEKSLRLISDKSRAAFLPINSYDIDMDLARSFPAVVCQRWCILPFDRMSKSIFVATTNPFNQQAARELSEATGSRLLWYLAPPAELIKNLQKAFRESHGRG